MPELPEVETILQGIQPHVEGHFVNTIIIRQRGLRWPIPYDLENKLKKIKVVRLRRRAKYLLFETTKGTAILHFGMSGSLTIHRTLPPPAKHDHFDIVLDSISLRYTDPRRFGALLWTETNPDQHPLISSLGPEPLEEVFNWEYLHQKAAGRSISTKQLIMNSHIVVGVGNIYAAEALFLARIHPLKAAKDLKKKECERLTDAIKMVLTSAIAQGGTTLKDFINTEGKPGYFKQKLNVYGRQTLPCTKCKNPLTLIRIQNRATVFCPICQS